jgi:2-dehydro-3-deoxy-D-gluconate 5-dehydrogenase
LVARMSLEGNVALVTGASRGIGRSIAIGLAEAGADVVLVARTGSGLKETAKGVESHGRRALAVEADVTNAEQVERAVEKAVAEFGRVHTLVNNAGTAVLKPFLDCASDDWKALLETNVGGLLNVTQALGRRMADAGGGSIINLGSIYGVVGAPGNSIYSLTKGGIMALTRTLAIEWARAKIRVNAICPGWIRTELTEEHMDNPKVAEAALRLIPLRRFGEPEDIAPLAVYLASEASSYVTGQCIVVDGGQTVR